MTEFADPIVEEIRAFRAEHAQQFDGNLAAICDDLRKIQQTCQHQIVAFSPKRIRPQRQASPRTGKSRTPRRVAVSSS